MAMMLGKLYVALRDAGVPDDRAREASEEVAGFENALDGVRAEVAALRTEVRVVQAVGGVMVVLMLAILWQLVALRGDLADVRASVTALETRMGRIEARMEAVETRLGRVETRLDAIERRLPQP